MGIKTKPEKYDPSKYNFTRKAGRSIIEHRPIFSPDGESLAVIVENVVRVYNIQTGECVKTLETESRTEDLISIQFLEDEGFNLYGCSKEGLVTTWTWQNGAVLRETKLSLPEDVEVISFNLMNSDNCCVTYTVNRLQVNICTCSMKTGLIINTFDQVQPEYFEIMKTSLGWCNGDRFAAITNGSNKIYVQNLNQPHIFSIIKTNNSMRVLSVACHPRESSIATVDTLGRLIIISGNLYNANNLAREVLHWHHLPVFDTCYSAEGNYLYSGGIEKVLVKWSLGSLANRAHEKMFITRLPGFIRYITTNNSNIALVLSNNSIVIASTVMRVTATILECGGLAPRAVGTSLLYQRQLGALVMGGRTGHLQLYSTTSDKVLYNIDITDMNSLPPQRNCLLPKETEVTCAALSGNGRWLVTSEYREDGTLYPEEKLKFWNHMPNTATPYKLNTCVNLSHGGCDVVSLALNHGGDYCVSAGNDQKFRIWKRVHNNNKVSWSCLTACYYSSGLAKVLSHDVLNNYKQSEPVKKGETYVYPYQKKSSKNDVVKAVFNIHKQISGVVSKPGLKDEEYDMGGVAIATDGSLIAAWFGCKLTLWDTHMCDLRTTLSHPALRPKGVHVRFGSADAAHYLVCTTENCLAVWSLLSLTVKWLVHTSPTCLAADSFSNRMAIVNTNNDVYVFTPQSAEPIFTKKALADPKKGVIQHCVFGNSSPHQFKLYMMRNNSEIYSLEQEDSEESRLEVISNRSLPASKFSALLAEQRSSEVRPAELGETYMLNAAALGNNAITQLLSAAPHMIPPVSLLSTTFLQQISGHEESVETNDDQDKEPINLEDSSSDEEDFERSKLNGPYAPKTTELWAPNYEKVKEKKLKKIMNNLLIQSTESIDAIFGS